MKHPNTPIGWASTIWSLLNAVHSGPEKFPIDVSQVAAGYSKQVFSSEPITLIEGGEMSSNFEGMLLPNPNKNGEWGIIFNSSIKSKGRINFTLAHEFGHYLLHRKKFPDGFKCSSKSMLNWESKEAQLEAEANTFASHLLMPLDDYREQINKKDITIELFENLSFRYETSLSAAILKWLEFTKKRAMIVVGKDGFIDWAWCSTPLFKSGIFYKARQVTTELPKKSLAYLKDPSINNKEGIKHPPGVWLGDEEVKEMTIFSDEYDEMSISLLIYPSHASFKYYDEDKEAEDSFDRMTRFIKN